MEALSAPPPPPTEDDEDDEPARKRQKRDTTDSGEYVELLANACSVDPRKEGVLSRPALKKLVLQRIFDIASQETTRDSNRRKMYAVWKAYADDDEDDEEEEQPPDGSETVFS